MLSLDRFPRSVKTWLQRNDPLPASKAPLALQLINLQHYKLHTHPSGVWQHKLPQHLPLDLPTEITSTSVNVIGPAACFRYTLSGGMFVRVKNLLLVLLLLSSDGRGAAFLETLSLFGEFLALSLFLKFLRRITNQTKTLVWSSRRGDTQVHKPAIQQISLQI